MVTGKEVGKGHKRMIIDTDVPAIPSGVLHSPLVPFG